MHFDDVLSARVLKAGRAAACERALPKRVRHSTIRCTDSMFA